MFVFLLQSLALFSNLQTAVCLDLISGLDQSLMNNPVLWVPIVGYCSRYFSQSWYTILEMRNYPLGKYYLAK